jgi:topoisomerase-4 subunit A
MRRDEYVTDCSDIDDIIVFTQDGGMMVTKVDSKTFVGKGIIHVAVFKKKDKRTIYNMIYRDGTRGATYVKRFAVTGVTRDKRYELTPGNKGSKVWYFTANPNGEAEVVTVHLRQSGSIKKLKFDLDFADLNIKGRGVKGNIVTKHPVKRVELKEKGLSTLKPRKIWFDDAVQRLNVDGRGELLGEFTSEDRLLLVRQNGLLKTSLPELTMHFDSDLVVLEKWEPTKPLSVVYWEGERELFYVKRFLVENPDKEELLITDHPKSYLERIFTDHRPRMEVTFVKERGKDRKEPLEIDLEQFISVKGITAMGNQLTKDKVLEINEMDPLPYDPPKPVPTEEIEVVDEEQLDNGTTGDDGGDEEPPKLDSAGQTQLF